MVEVWSLKPVRRERPCHSFSGRALLPGKRRKGGLKGGNTRRTSLRRDSGRICRNLGGGEKGGSGFLWRSLYKNIEDTTATGAKIPDPETNPRGTLLGGKLLTRCQETSHFLRDERMRKERLREGRDHPVGRDLGTRGGLPLTGNFLLRGFEGEKKASQKTHWFADAVQHRNSHRKQAPC